MEKIHGVKNELTKTICVCGICNKEIRGNSEWKTEEAMWGHIKAMHPSEVRRMDDTNKVIYEKMNALLETKVSLYTTEVKGKKHPGSWVI